MATLPSLRVPKRTTAYLKEEESNTNRNELKNKTTQLLQVINVFHVIIVFSQYQDSRL